MRLPAPSAPAAAEFFELSDIFREIDEELRRDRLMSLWQRYGIFIVALAVLIVAAIGGWRAYEWWEARRAAEAGAAFEAALSLEEQQKGEEAAAAFDRIAKQGGAGGYPTLARLQEADRLAVNDRAAAVKAYEALAADRGVPPALQELARVRAALLLLGTASYDELRARVEPLTAGDRSFRHTAREIMALAAFQAGDAASVQRWSDMIVGDPEAPPGTRSRAEMLLALSAPQAKS